MPSGDKKNHLSRGEPDHWRERVQDARAQADVADDPRTRAKLLGAVKAYEAMARRAETSLATLVKRRPRPPKE